MSYIQMSLFPTPPPAPHAAPAPVVAQDAVVVDEDWLGDSAACAVGADEECDACQ